MSDFHDHKCRCGTSNKPEHETGQDGCKRFMTKAPPWRISEYTAKYQRGYHQHPCGCWSRWEGSHNSMDD